MSRKKSLVIVCLALAISFAPFSSAFAQRFGGSFSSTTTTVVSTAAIAGGVILTIMLAKKGSEEASLENYLRHNAVAIQHDLYMGGGEAARDLAQFFDIQDEHFDAFAHVLFEQRHELTKLAEPGQIDAVSTYQFVEIIVESMMENPRLAAHLQSIV